MRKVYDLFLIMATLHRTVQSVPLSHATHLVIEISNAAKLNEHILELQRKITAAYKVNYTCAFVHDEGSMPRTFVPQINAKRKEKAEELIQAISGLHAGSIICFELVSGGSFACFDIISEIMDLETCKCYSNVTKLHFVECGESAILVLGYESV